MYIGKDKCTETEMPYGRNFRHWLCSKFSNWQRPVHSMTKIPSKCTVLFQYVKNVDFELPRNTSLLAVALFLRVIQDGRGLIANPECQLTWAPFY